MPEQQNIEYKSVWKDDYLKWICGFANAQGGRIFIGKNDDGTVAGLKNYKKLLEDLPNKITAMLGIVCDVNLHEQKVGDSQTPQGDFIENADSASANRACSEFAEHKAFIEIVVEPQPNPVNYKGEYHYRSGSTKQ
jgi:ATP-dependent DNA helicase RecG